MLLALNENMPATVIAELRGRGHDVLSVKESMRGAKDVEILEKAQTELRLVVTQDKDFGELAYRRRLPADCGIILFRLSGTDPDADIRRMIEVIESRNDWNGQFGVATDDRVRMRPLPKAGKPR
jgi:predicted nuclease of predicted toxin-antitoxin system